MDDQQDDVLGGFMQRPDYKGSRDEIVRMSIEIEFERSIRLKKCCEKNQKNYSEATMTIL